ncbi:glutamate racemase [Alphaproteobacteria bacterium]|nr:glutamate racemase [Alphaproteobacteria bacterium]
MKIGVFDSGLGGLIITRALTDALGRYDFAYLGDTAHLPYGSKSNAAIYSLTLRCVDRLFSVHDCKLVVVACNTATIVALRKLQQEYLPARFPDRRILGIVIPTLESAALRGFRHVGVIATEATVRAGVYQDEMRKLNPAVRVSQLATPLLVPLIENDGDRYAEPVVRDYLAWFADKDIDALLLGCTHYPHYKDMVARVLGPGVAVLSQDEIVPASLADYLRRHPEIEECLGRRGGRRFGVTDLTDSYARQARRIYGADITTQKEDIST